MKAIAYTRVSTDRQVEGGAGLKTQRATIETVAAEQGHEVIGWYSDKALSGADDLDVRVGLGAAIGALRHGDAEVLIVYRLDRFSRDLVLQEQLLREIWTAGGKVVSCSPAESQFLVDDPRDPSRRLIRQVLGAISEYERAMIRMRLRAGAERARDAGKRNAFGGRAPFGWRSVERELVAEEGEQEVLRMIHGWRRQGWSCRRIADELNRVGVLRANGSLWHHEKVKRALMHKPEEVASV